MAAIWRSSAPPADRIDHGDANDGAAGPQVKARLQARFDCRTSTRLTLALQGKLLELGYTSLVRCLDQAAQPWSGLSHVELRILNRQRAPCAWCSSPPLERPPNSTQAHA